MSRPAQPQRAGGMTIADRLLSHVEIVDGHWLWTGATNNNGYSQFGVDGRTRSGHRVCYELFVGPIPDGLQLDHLCRVRHCINPDHLEPVTNDENRRRSPINGAAKTQCVRGHALDGPNLRVNKNGHRSCRTCNRENEAARRDRLSAAA